MAAGAKAGADVTSRKQAARISGKMREGLSPTGDNTKLTFYIRNRNRESPKGRWLRKWGDKDSEEERKGRVQYPPSAKGIGLPSWTPVQATFMVETTKREIETSIRQTRERMRVGNLTGRKGEREKWALSRRPASRRDQHPALSTYRCIKGHKKK